ncbi:MAG: tRNA-intron lyase [Candidatus Bilamarchaeaceae archaeon]
MLKLELDRKKKKVYVREPEEVSSLANGFYGIQKKSVIELFPEEVLYIMDIRNGKCLDTSLNAYSFNDVAELFAKNRKFLARYLTYKDWRDKGLFIRPIDEAHGNYGRGSRKKYSSVKFQLDKYSFQGVFFKDDLITIVDDEAVGKDMYERYWFGQFGTYKAAHRGRISKFDIYETLYLSERGALLLKNSKVDEVRKIARKRINYFDDMFTVYSDWRDKGYVVKTGFKFGTHFRIYFPGASPVRTQEEWLHSKHVIHCFPRKSKLLISEWARAIRVAHSVKKTFILSIPGKKLPKKERKHMLDFLLYGRKDGGVESPKEGAPRYLMFSLSEDEYLGGEELARALQECAQYGLEMMVAIADRESAVTYYMIKRLDLPGSDYEYFEIEWVQP